MVFPVFWENRPSFPVVPHLNVEPLTSVVLGSSSCGTSHCDAVGLSKDEFSSRLSTTDLYIYIAVHL